MTVDITTNESSASKDRFAVPSFRMCTLSFGSVRIGVVFVAVKQEDPKQAFKKFEFVL